MHIGTDIVKISRFDSITAGEIPKRIFCSEEWQYICSKKKRSQCASGMFAAKEAILKCLGAGISYPLTDIEIHHKNSGKPFCVLTGKLKALSEKMGIESIDITISHDGEYAIAFAVTEEDENLKLYNTATTKLDGAGDDYITHESIKELLPKRKEDTHKGDYGRLFVLAGSVGLTGAAIMSCTSALRCGAGLITLGCANELNPIFEVSLTEVMTKPLHSSKGLITSYDIDTIMEYIDKSDVCLLGPGLGRSADITDTICHIITHTKTPCVLDADAIYAVSQSPDILKRKSCEIVLTPHIGEFSYLTGIDTDKLKNPYKIATTFATENSVTLILKSHKTLVATPDGNLFKNILGNPGMATGGSGDVLSGSIASFMAQGKSAHDSARLGVYIHSLAADMAALKMGEYSLTPSDILKFIPLAIKYSQTR